MLFHTPVPVALVMTSFEPGGTERQMIELVRRIDASRWEMHVACFHARGGWLTHARASAASVTEFPITSFRHASTVRQARSFGRWCRDKGIRVVHTADLYANVFALPSAAAADVPVRLGSRRDINPDKTLPLIALQRAAYSCAHGVIANSRAAFDRLRLEGVSARRITVIPNGVDVDRFSAASDAAAPTAGDVGSSRQRRRVLMVANLRPGKGHDTLIDAMPSILRRFPDATFDIAGAGPERSRLMSHAAKRGVEGAVSWLGHRDDVEALAAAADMFVLPSRSEAFPNALLEAMAAGLPVVATRVGGIPEIVDEGRTGLLVQRDDPAELADAVCRLMSDARLAAALGAAACLRIRACYSFERMTAQVEALYAASLSRRDPAEQQPMAS